MQIQSTKRPAPARNIVARAQAQESQQQKTFKPFQESWQIGEDIYASTADLVQANGNLDNVEAVYRYTTEEVSAPFSRAERIKNATGDGIKGGAIGAIGGGAVGAGLAILHTAGDILGGFMGGSMSGTSAAVITVPILIGAAIGAGVGGVNGYKAEPSVNGGEVQGLLSKTHDGTAFFPSGKVDKKVDLSTFQDAPVPDITPESTGQSKPIMNAVKGAAAGLAVLPGQFIPLAGIFGPTVIGGKVGEALDKRTSLGEGLGMLGGATVTGAAMYAVSQATGYGETSYLPLIGVAGGLATVGAVIGDKVFTAMDTVPAHRDYGQQWWNQGSE
jgi:hypothetical protein